MNRKRNKTDNLLIKNVAGSTIFQVLGYFLNFIVRMVFVRILGGTYTGISSTFLNILGVLSLAELGIGSAIGFSLYEPLAKKDEKKTAALMALFRKVYIVIGIMVAGIGVLLLPFLKYIIKPAEQVSCFYFIYLLYLADASLSYFYSYKFTVLSADQREYIIGKYRFFCDVCKSLIQIAVLYFWGNFILYLMVQLIFRFLYNITLSCYVDKKYPYLNKEAKLPIDPAIKANIFYKVKSLLYHKIAGTVLISTDSILISGFAGVVLAGIYSNYMLVSDFVTQVCNMIFSTLTARIGHILALKTKEDLIGEFKKISFIGIWLNGFCCVCLYSLYNLFIELAFGREFVLDDRCMLLIVVRFYLLQRRNISTVFINAKGLFHKTQGVMIISSLLNIVMSVILGQNYGVNGIVFATIVSTLLTFYWYEPYINFKYILEIPMKDWFVRDSLNLLKISVILLAVDAITPYFKATFSHLIKKGICTILIFAVLFTLFHLRQFWHYYKNAQKWKE